MPFTPFHFGPGLLLKSVAPERLSVASYAAVNVVIDVESAYHLMRHDLTVHCWAHTFLGAGLVGLAVGLVMAAGRRSISRWPGLARSMFPEALPAGPIVLGAVLGGLTHPLLDGLMHFDIHPLRPFTDANPFLGLVTVGMLETGCVAAGVLGALILLSRRATWTALACLLLIAPTAARVQIAHNGHLRLGAVARSLSDSDVEDLDRAARAHGAVPWIFNGPRGPRADVESIEAFGTPTLPRPDLRRGPLVTLVRHRAPDGAWGPWTAGATAEFAQVAVPGRAFTRIEDDLDINRPFRVAGRFSDAELLALVALIRSSPSVPGPSGAIVQGRWPICGITRDAGGQVSVMLHQDDRSGQRVLLRHESGAWTIVSAGPWTP